jgi:hypothetical protein
MEHAWVISSTRTNRLERRGTDALTAEILREQPGQHCFTDAGVCSGDKACGSPHGGQYQSGNAGRKPLKPLTILKQFI